MARLNPTVVAFSVCAGSCFTSHGHAATFGFAADPNEFISNYEGFIWSGDYGSTSWVNGSVVPIVPDTTCPSCATSTPAAPLGYAWSNGGTNVSMNLATAGTFILNSIALYGNMDLTGPAGSPSAVLIEGLLNGVVVDTYVTPVLDTLINFTTLILNWSNINEVTFSDTAGEFTENILITDVNVSSVPVPPPTSVPEVNAKSGTAVIALLLGVLALAGERRRRQAV
jgi:hypothetical protein